MTEKEEHQIAIVGAGPAGATLALFLAKKKIPHVLIDKAKFPRDKICGDGYTAEVMRVLRELDENLYKEFISADWIEPAHGWYFDVPNWVGFDIDTRNKLKEGASFYVGKRKDFDHWLQSKANSEYTTKLLGWRVRKVERDEDGVDLHLTHQKEKKTIRCQLVVGADGERSVVRQHLSPAGINKKLDHHLDAIRCYFKGVERVYDHSPLEMYITKTPDSYFWIFMLPNNEANVGIGSISKTVRDKKLNLKKALFETIEENPKLKARFKNAEALETPQFWGIPLNSDAYNFTGDRFILLGDSAKFGEPATGKGIGVSMLLARYCEQFISKAIEKNDFSAKELSKFEQFVEGKMRKEWDYLKKLQDIDIKRPRNYLILLLVNIPIIKQLAIKRFTNRFNRFVFRDFSKES